ncbi:hypothetical protein GGX14DRAFT_372410 [Mycena pura]|uniref:Uncharacterized protein n=1 Tax=Mycena pura TaxID=153505 RepID=A0AAD6Y912_9AGAR|nr:hypothetical protein GGX14DRAFT_372410 [Mycena pura]
MLFLCASADTWIGTVKRFQTKLDGQPSSDRSSTSNLKKHAVACYGKAVVAARLDIKLEDAGQRDGNIFSAFARAGQRPVKVTHRGTHTEPEFRCAGRPELKVPSRHTVARDLNAAYARCSDRVKNLLETYNGKLSFATDAWTSPNHRAFVAWTVHLQHEGQPLVFLLDIYEVPEVCCNLPSCSI